MTEKEFNLLTKFLRGEAAANRQLAKAMVRQKLYTAAGLHSGTAESFDKLCMALEYRLKAAGIYVDRPIPPFATKKKVRG